MRSFKILEVVLRLGNRMGQIVFITLVKAVMESSEGSLLSERNFRIRWMSRSILILGSEILLPL